MATLKEVWDVVKTKLKAVYWGDKMHGVVQSATISPLFPFEIAYQNYKADSRPGGRSRFEHAAKGFCTAVRGKLTHGPVLNIACLGIPFIIEVAREVHRRDKKKLSGEIQPTTDPKNKGRFFGKANYQGVGDQKPIVLTVPEDNSGVVQQVSPVERKVVPDQFHLKNLGKTRSLPMAPFSDQIARKVYHGLYLAGMREEKARAFANGETGDADVATLFESGEWNEQDLEAFNTWFSVLAVAN